MLPIAALWLALLVDRCLGEPPARLHPVVWMGHYLGWAGRRIAPQREQAVTTRDLQRFISGALAWLLGAVVVVAVAWGLLRFIASWNPWLSALALGLLLKPLLAWSMLRGEVLAAEAALAQSLDAGRQRLSQLVSREVQDLSVTEVRESAIESLAENLNDSVIAPLFWWVLLGLPGAALYRYANTADAMWGYRGLRGGRDWTWAGKWAARADDMLSWLPARITAGLLLLVAPRTLYGAPRGLRREAARTPSPNSGWPMAAMALALGVRLGKPGVYVLHAAGRAPQATDTVRSAVFGARAVGAGAVLASVCLGLGLGWRAWT